jgi:hypothetical protein
MPNPNDVETKITYLADQAVSEYGVDPEFMQVISERAKRINRRAKFLGFFSTDVFMGEDGTFCVTAYSKKGSIGVAVLINNFDIYIEEKRDLVDFETELTEPQIFRYLYQWGNTWRSSVYYQGTHTIRTMEEASIPSHFGIEERVASRSSTQIVSPHMGLVSVGS